MVRLHQAEFLPPLGEGYAAEHAARWLADNRLAIDSTNTYVDRHGLPLESYRPV